MSDIETGAAVRGERKLTDGPWAPEVRRIGCTRDLSGGVVLLRRLY